MATPHLTRSRRRSSGDGVRSACCAIAPGSSDPRLPTPSQTCTPQPAPCCVAEPQELAHSLPARGERANPGSTAARHVHGALLRDGCVLPRARLPHSPPAHPPARRTLWRTHPPAETRVHGCRCVVPLRTHTESFLSLIFFSVADFYGEERAGFYGKEDQCMHNRNRRFSFQPHRYG